MVKTEIYYPFMKQWIPRIPLNNDTFLCWYCTTNWWMLETVDITVHKVYIANILGGFGGWRDMKFPICMTQNPFIPLGYIRSHMINSIMSWMGAHHVENDVIQRTWCGCLYHARADLYLYRCKSVDRSILFVIHGDLLTIHLNLINPGYSIIKSHYFSQITTKIGFYCEMLTYDLLSQRQVSGDQHDICLRINQLILVWYTFSAPLGKDDLIQV